MSEHHKLWREICEKFFCENPDPQSQRMMDYYMDVLQNGRCDAKVKESPVVVAMFDAMTSTSISEFEKIKNEVRQHYHQNASKQRQIALRDTIQSFVKTSEDEDFQSPNLEDVKNFARTYGEARGCQPFVYGLCEFLHMQIGKSKIYYWECNDAAITDTEVKCFASDAAKLMRYAQVKPKCVERRYETMAYEWKTQGFNHSKGSQHLSEYS